MNGDKILTDDDLAQLIGIAQQILSFVRQKLNPDASKTAPVIESLNVTLK